MSTDYSPAFLVAVEQLLRDEGGFADHPNDPGGATNHGVSLRYLRGVGDLDGDGWPEGDVDHDGDVDADDIHALTEDQAIDLVWRDWWYRYDYFLLPAPVASKVLNLAFWMGPGRAHRLLQQALKAAQAPVDVDGRLGPQTRAAVDRVQIETLLAALRSEAAGWLRLVVARRPAMRVFEAGWVARAYR